jgi:hypothetical protein
MVYNINMKTKHQPLKRKIIMWFFLAFMIIAINIDKIMDIFGL